MNNKNKGFTLIELMTSVGIISILLALASPGLSAFVKNNKITTSAKNFYSDLNYAKSEALKGSGNVVMKAVTGSAYADGWIIFVDMNGNGSYDSGDIILRQQDALPTNQLITIGSQNYLSFNSYGEINSTTPLSFKFCDDRTGATGKNISINPIGLIKVVDTTC
jgi:type IV fimbrial biogenesis protein FimT